MITRKLAVNTLCEFGPILAFLAVYEVSSFRFATLTIILATLVALIALKVIEDHVPLFAVFSMVTIIIFGLTSYLVDIPSIFILRDTIFDAVFGTILLVSLFTQQPLLKTLFGHVFLITDKGWAILTRRWGLFFLGLACVNEWVRMTMSPDTWVTAKVLMIVWTIVFGMYQFTLSRRERLLEATSWGLVR